MDCFNYVISGSSQKGKRITIINQTKTSPSTRAAEWRIRKAQMGKLLTHQSADTDRYFFNNLVQFATLY
jgi:hypothetical protein